LKLAARVPIPKQALPDEERARAGAVKATNIIGGIDPALSNSQCCSAIALEQALGSRKVGRKRVKVAVIDADDLRPYLDCRAHLDLVVNLN
jgi:hypothetical protein